MPNLNPVSSPSQHLAVAPEMWRVRLLAARGTKISSLGISTGSHPLAREAVHLSPRTIPPFSAGDDAERCSEPGAIVEGRFDHVVAERKRPGARNAPNVTAQSGSSEKSGNGCCNFLIAVRSV